MIKLLLLSITPENLLVEKFLFIYFYYNVLAVSSLVLSIQTVRCFDLKLLGFR